MWTNFFRVLGMRAPLAIVAALTLAGCGLVGGSMMRGQRAMEAGDFDAAVLHYGRAVQDGESLPLAYANRCIALDSIGRHDEAVADCTASLDASEGVDVEGYERHVVLNNRAVAFLNVRKDADAITDLDLAIELAPDYAEAYANRGRAAIAQERYDEAIEDLNHAIELNDQMSQAFGNRGFAWQQMGKDVEAIADYTRAIEIDNNPEAYFNRASIRYALGRFEEAYADYKSVLEYGPGTYRAFIAQTQADVLGLLPSIQEAEGRAESTSDTAEEDAGEPSEEGTDMAEDEGGGEATKDSESSDEGTAEDGG